MTEIYIIQAQPDREPGTILAAYSDKEKACEAAQAASNGDKWQIYEVLTVPVDQEPADSGWNWPIVSFADGIRLK